MNRFEDNGVVCRFSPHLSDVCKPPVVMAFAAGLFYGGFLLAGGSPDRIGMALSCVLMVFSLTVTLHCLLKNRRTVCEMTRNTVRVASPVGEKIMKLDALDRVEVCGGVFSGMTGSRRVRIFSHARKKAWFSKRLSEKDTHSLLRAIVPLGRETGRTLSGRYSAAAYALTSEKTVIPIIISLQFTLLAGSRTALNAFSYVMLAAALFHIGAVILGTGRVSLTRCEYGCRVVMSLGKRRMIYIPEHSLAGASVRRGPAELLCGTGSVHLITENGSKIPCMRMLPEREIIPAVRRILGTEGTPFVSFSDAKERSRLARHYAVQFAASVFSAFVAAVFTFGAEETAPRFLTCLALSVFTCASLGNLAGSLCAAGLGLKVSSSCVYSAGMSGCACAAVCLKRNKVAGIRINSPLLGRMNGLCHAGLLTGSGGAGVWSRYVAYPALKGFAGRFC